MTARLVLCASLTMAIAGVQEPATSRQIDITLTEGTSMSAAVSPDRRSIAIDLLGSLWILPAHGGEADHARAARGAAAHVVP